MNARPDGSSGLGERRKIQMDVRKIYRHCGQKSDPNIEEKAGYYGEKLVLKDSLFFAVCCQLSGVFLKKS